MGGLNTLTRITGFRKGLGTRESIFSDTSLVGWWKANKRVNDRLLKDMSRRSHHMYFGSAKAAAIVDGGLVIAGPGTTANAATPDSPSISIVGDIDVRMFVSPYSWRASAAMSPFGKWGSPQQSYWVYIDSTGAPHLVWSTTGSDSNDIQSNATIPANSGAMWLRATLDVDNGAAGHTVTFYTSPDGGVTWIVLGAPIVIAGVTSIFDGSASLVIGLATIAGSFPFNGSIYYVEVRNGINGAVVAAFDARNKADGTTTWVGPQGNVWNVNSPAVTTNDPQPLDFDQVNGKCAYVPGVNGNYISTPDQAALRVAGNIDVRVKLARDDWTSTSKVFVGRYNFTSNLRSWRLMADVAGGVSAKISLNVSMDGTGANGYTSTVPVPFAAGQTGWLRATLVLDNGAGNSVCTFYTSADGVTWTQLGAAVTSGVVTGIFPAVGVPLEVGSNNGGQNADFGKYYYAEVRDGINGPVVASFDASQWSEPFAYHSNTPNLLDKDTSDVEGSLGQWRNDASGGAATATVARVPGAGVGGSAAAVGTVTAAGSGSAILAAAQPGISGIPCAPGQTLSFVASVLGLVGGGRTVGTSANFYDVAGTYISTLGFLGAGVATTGAFQTLTGQCIVPANAFYCYPRTYLSGVIVGDTLTVDSAALFVGTVNVWSVGSVPWRANRTTSGRKLAFVDRTMLLLGTDDYLEALNHSDFNFATVDSYTLVAVLRRHGVASGSSQWIAKRDSTVGTNVGWSLQTAATDLAFSRMTDVSTATLSAQVTISPPGVVASQIAVVDRVAETLTVVSGSNISPPGSIGTLGDLTNTNVVNIGRATPPATAFADMEFVAAAVFRRALSAAEIQQIQDELVKVGV